MSRLPGGADLLLDLDLDGQAVAIPAALARHEVAGHRLEARVHVLERPRLDVMDPGFAVRGRGALVEDPERIVLPQLDAAGEHVGLAPELEDALLELREADLRVHRFEPPHPPPPPLAPHNAKTPRPLQGRGVGPAVPPRLPGAFGARPLTAAITASRCHGRGPAASTAGSRTSRRTPVRAAARGGSSRRSRAGLPPSPARFGQTISATRSRRRLWQACYTSTWRPSRCEWLPGPAGPPSRADPTASSSECARPPREAGPPRRPLGHWPRRWACRGRAFDCGAVRARARRRSTSTGSRARISSSGYGAADARRRRDRSRFEGCPCATLPRPWPRPS